MARFALLVHLLLEGMILPDLLRSRRGGSGIDRLNKAFDIRERGERIASPGSAIGARMNQPQADMSAIE